MSEELTPMNHRELWLQAIATGTVPEWLEPMTHEELWLKTIAQGGGGGGGAQLPVEIVTYTYNPYISTYECDHTYEDILDAYHSGVPCVAVLKRVDSQSNSWAYADSVSPIKIYYPGERVWMMHFETISSSETASATIQKYVARIEHKSDGSITKKWQKKYTITFDT